MIIRVIQLVAEALVQTSRSEAEKIRKISSFGAVFQIKFQRIPVVDFFLLLLFLSTLLLIFSFFLSSRMSKLKNKALLKFLRNFLGFFLNRTEMEFGRLNAFQDR